MLLILAFIVQTVMLMLTMATLLRVVQEESMSTEAMRQKLLSGKTLEPVNGSSGLQTTMDLMM